MLAEIITTTTTKNKYTLEFPSIYNSFLKIYGTTKTLMKTAMDFSLPG